ncbi:AI-2E family transporter [Trichocoleus sp. FACHB-591]|uniref:AI-2E family transporter n=1 Tax=Trichocoleus sp. FACHB-591 TaxID=2692872 RepID=UPI001685897B|nr:AI-2E family transporter [Trichocoleus sp. FACHB-591]MBD2093985.1 AI-2E family transporter [Trichocoleus sp. FACHB-591]
MKMGQWIGLIALLVSMYILWQIRQVLLLVFMAVVFATALNRLVRRLRRSGAKRGLAALLAITCFVVFFIVFAAVTIPPFVEQFQELTELVPRGLERLRIWVEALRTQLPGQPLRYLPSANDLTRQIQPFASWAFNNFFSLFSNFLAILLNLLLVMVLTIMLLVNPAPYRHGFVLLFPSFYRRRADEILAKCEIALVNWMGGILINMVVIGLVSAVGLWLLRVPLVLANAAIAGLLEAIPTVGPTLSLIPPMAIALLDAPWKAGAVLAFYVGIQQLEQFLLVPFVMSKQVAILPAVTLLSQVIFAIFFGFLGLFLAIPLVIVGQIWVEEVLVKDVLDQWGAESKSSKTSAPVEVVNGPVEVIDHAAES